MDLPEKLLELAKHLGMLESPSFEEATLRRAVSTTYYALFHLLVSATAANWNPPATRAAFGRLLDHGKMKSACEKKIQEIKTLLKTAPADPVPAADLSILKVAEAFVRLHQHRTSADYDASKVWSQNDVLAIIDIGEAAFENWKTVSGTPEAQRFLFTFLAKDR